MYHILCILMFLFLQKRYLSLKKFVHNYTVNLIPGGTDFNSHDKIIDPEK